MKQLTRRARILLAGSVAGVLGTGLIGALAMPASARTTSAPAAAPASSGPLVQVCLTVREIHFGPACVAV